MKKKYIKQDFSSKAKWLKARKFGGSSASAILDSNPYISKIDLYNTITNPKGKKNIKDNETLSYGRQCEELIRKQFTLDFKGTYIVHDPIDYEMYIRKDKPYLTATLDGTLKETDSKRKGVLEIKTHDIRNKKDFEEWENKLPQNYYIQVLHYLMVLNDYKFAILVAKLRFFDYFNADGKKLLKTETRYYYIEKSEVQNDIDNLEKAETHFYEYNIKKRVMPKIKIKF